MKTKAYWKKYKLIKKLAKVYGKSKNPDMQKALAKKKAQFPEFAQEDNRLRKEMLLEPMPVPWSV